MPVEPGINLPFDFRVFYFHLISVARAEPENTRTFIRAACDRERSRCDILPESAARKRGLPCPAGLGADILKGLRPRIAAASEADSI